MKDNEKALSFELEARKCRNCNNTGIPEKREKNGIEKVTCSHCGAIIRMTKIYANTAAILQFGAAA